MIASLSTMIEKIALLIANQISRRGIEPNTGLNPFSKIALNVFCMHNTDFSS